jgi:cytochrome P450
MLPLGNRKAKLRRLVGEELERGRAHASTRRDLLARLIGAKDEAGEPLADDVLYAQLRSILLGAHDTSAITLSWATHFVLRDRVASELVSVGQKAEPEAAHVDAILKETLRIRPVAHHTARVAKRAFTLGSYTVPRGVYVLPSQAVTHFRDALWDAPREFRAERFLGAAPSPYQYFPFGGGSRACLGRAFALLQMRILLTRMLERVTLRLAPGADSRPAMCGLLVGPSDGVPVVVDRVR